MQQLFFQLLRLSLTGSVLALAVMLVRLIFRKAPKWIFCLLWCTVALRLILPFTLETPVSLVPEDIASGELITEVGEAYVGRTETMYLYNADDPDRIISTYVTQEGSSLPPKTVKEAVYPVLPWIWLGGALLMLLYIAVSYFILWRKMAEATRLQGNIWQCENAESPFVLGIFRPRIYLPYTISEEDASHVIAHEKAHIRRRDHWWKPIGFLLLSLHWFNPVLWLAYILLCRDIEAACDEKVIRNMEKSQMQAYSKALLNCSVRRRSIAACPLAFGEVGVKSRIKAVMHYKKPAFWIIIAAVVACVVVAVCFLTNPTARIDDPLTVFIDCQIADHHQNLGVVDRAYCQSWEVLGTKKRGKETTVYMWVLYEEFTMKDGELLCHTSSHTPTVITARREDGNYRLVEYWEPEDSTQYEQDIREKFPWHLRRKALDSPRYLLKQKKETTQMALDYLEGLAENDGLPQIRNPWVQPYTPGTDGIIGNVDTEKYNRISADFAIGADRRGMAVFKNPYKAFNTFQTLYADAIELVAAQYELAPLTESQYAPYKTYGWQTDCTDPDMKERLNFVTGFLDLYENSFTTEVPTPNVEIVETFRTGLCTYYKLSDGTWRTDGRNYKYRLVITGRLHNAATDSIFIYLSNLEEITFEQAWRAAGLSSNMDDYFQPEEAVLVEFGSTDTTPDKNSALAPEALLDSAIDQAILQHNRTQKQPAGAIRVESCYVLGVDTKSGTPLAGNTNHTEEVSAYVQYVYKEYNSTGTTLEELSAIATVANLTFSYDPETGYQLKEYRQPAPGSEFQSDVEKLFPEAIAKLILDPQRTDWYTLDLESRCHTKAVNDTSGITGSNQQAVAWVQDPTNDALTAFRFQFDIPYTTLTAKCSDGALIHLDRPNKAIDTEVSLNPEDALFWSPALEEGHHKSSRIDFTLYDGETAVYRGYMSITGSALSSGSYAYVAVLDCSGLTMDVNEKNVGAMIRVMDE